MKTDQALALMSGLLDNQGRERSNTSMRLPTAPRQAAALAVNELGAAPSTTALTCTALRSMLEAIVMQAVLNEHYARYPEAHPSLADLAVAAAELDGHPLAAEPQLVRQAAAEIAQRHPYADTDDVLLWAEAHALASA